MPAVFVRGKHIGGAAEVTRMEEGKLKALHQGQSRARVWCAGCAGVGFVICRDCNGSSKVRVDGERKETVQCGGCNENSMCAARKLLDEMLKRECYTDKWVPCPAKRFNLTV